MMGTYPSVGELERIVAADRGTNLARERREDRAAMALCDEIEDSDKDRSEDLVEETLIGWRDPLTGYPTRGFEGPRFERFHDARMRDYFEFVTGDSDEAARTRAIRHPKLVDRMSRGVWDTEDRARPYDEVR